MMKLHIPSRLLERLKLHQQTRVIVIAILVGLFASLLTVAFRYGIEGVSWMLQTSLSKVFGVGSENVSGLFAGGIILQQRFEPEALILVLFPVIGAVFVWLLRRYVTGFDAGYGFPRFLMAVNLRGGMVRFRQALTEGVAAVITIGSGASAGIESPIATLGGMAGSTVGRLIQASGMRMRLLVACGVAASIASNFNAPIAGVLFAFEIVLLGSYEVGSFGAVVISAGMGTVVSRWILGDYPAFHPPEFSFQHGWELGLYALLGVLCGILGAGFIRFFFWVKSRFAALPGREATKLLGAATAVGLIAMAFPQVMGSGYNVIQAALSAAYPGPFVAAVFVAKAVATALTVGSGMAGGLFGPPMLMGTMLGAGFGSAMQDFFNLPIKVTPYAMMGMSGLLAAVTHAPLTAIFLLFELTGNYQVVVPAMFVTIIAVAVGSRLTPHSIDGEQLHRLGVNLDEGRDATALSAIGVADVMQTKFTTVNRRMAYEDLVDLFSSTQETYFPVIDDAGDMLGIVSFQDIRTVMSESMGERRLVAGDLATQDIISVTPHDNLQVAMRRFNLKDIASMPVVDPQNARKVLGMLQRKDVLDSYNREVLRREITRF